MLCPLWDSMVWYGEPRFDSLLFISRFADLDLDPVSVGWWYELVCPRIELYQARTDMKMRNQGGKERERESRGREVGGDAVGGYWRVAEALEGQPRPPGLHGPLQVRDRERKRGRIRWRGR